MPRRSFASSAVLTYATNVAVAVLGLVNVLIIARALGPEGRGSVAFLTTVAYLTSQLFTLGVQQANANFAAKEPERTTRIAGNSAVLAFAVGGVAVALVAALVALFPSVGAGSDTALRWLALGSVPFLILQVYVQQIAIAHYGFGVSNLSWLLGPVTNVLVNGTVAVAGSLTVGVAVGSWVGGQMLALVTLVWWLHRRHGGFGRPDAQLARRQLGFGVRAHLARVMTLGNYRLDQWLLGAMAGPKQLGYYSVAVSWAEALFFLPTTLALVQRPDLVRSTGDDAGRRAAVVFRAAIVITVVLALGMVLLAPFLCVTVFGPEFEESVDQLRILALGAFGIVALKLFGNALVAQGRPLLEMRAVAVAFALILGIDLLLIPSLEGTGAAIGSLVGYSAGGVLIVWIVVRHLRLTGGDVLPRPRDAVALVRSVRDLANRRRGVTPAS